MSGAASADGGGRSERPLTVFTSTWNVGNKCPTKQDLAFLKKAKVSGVAFGKCSDVFEGSGLSNPMLPVALHMARVYQLDLGAHDIYL
eukprot:3954570-Pyramimonas_sp.AAC.2